MKIKILSSNGYNGARGNVPKGGTIDLPENEAQQLIDGRYGEAVETASVVPAETAVKKILKKRNK
jgi:hypothetical protein